MSEQISQFELTEPPMHETSSKILNLIIYGYTREMEISMQKTIPDDVYQLCEQFYPKSCYMTVLNQQILQLTLSDISTNDTSLSSNEVRALDKRYKSNEFGGNQCCGIAYKEEIDFKNDKYNAIFKYGGQIDDRWSEGLQDCGLILYPKDITKKEFNPYYYKLPSLPFEKNSQYNDPSYSDTYGLIILGFNGKDANIARLNIFNPLSINDGNDIKWNVDKLPNEIFSISDIIFTPSYCLINNNEKELFIMNGAKGEQQYNKNTAIYNLETKEYKIIDKNNRNATCNSSILYCNKKNRVYVAGGRGNVAEQRDVYYYDLENGKYQSYGKDTNEPYVHPLLWTNESGTILNIAGVYIYHDTKKIHHEWLDLREPHKWISGWKTIDNMNQLSKKIWQTNQFENLLLVNCD